MIRSPLSKLHHKLLSNKELNIQLLAKEYENKIKSLPRRSDIEEYIFHFLSLSRAKSSQGDHHSEYYEYFKWFKNNLTPLMHLDASSDAEVQARQIYANTGWFDFHSYLNRDTTAKREILTLVTSMFGCEEWIPICLDNIIQQTYFSKSTILLFDCERNPKLLQRALPYLQAHENIKYFRLTSDPGLYGVWNMAALMSRSDYLGNMNTDDLRHPFQIADLIQFLDQDRNCLLASTAIVPYQEEDIQRVVNRGLEQLDHTSLWRDDEEPWFAFLEGLYSIHNLFRLDQSGNAVDSQCIPHCAPIWRRSIHDTVGFFNEKYFSSAADWGLWLNVLANGGSAYVSSMPYTYYFVNPTSYMRRDSNSSSLTEKICEAFNKDQILSLLSESVLLKPDEDPRLLIDLALNI